MKYLLRKYPQFAACGLNCGLCPRYYTKGSSRCPGCSGEGFNETHCSCSIIACCQRKEIEYCYMCEEYPCSKYEKTWVDSFISCVNIFHDAEKAKQIGLETYINELNTKMDILKILLENYDDGRRKSFYCLAVNLLDLQDVKSVIDKIGDKVAPQDTLKEKAKIVVGLFQATAMERGIELKLRK